MLIEFKVTNFLSIRESQTLSMVAGSGKERQNTLHVADFDPNVKLIPSAAIYGSNASGKSNLIAALRFVQSFVVKSAKESQHGEAIPVTPFLFDKTSKKNPSQFEVTFSVDKNLYQYGFAVDQSRIHQEWLYVSPSKRYQQWFLRQYDKKTKKYQWKFSKYFTGKKQLWTDATRDNALFLSTAVQLNNEQLIPVFDWFQNTLVIVSEYEQLHALGKKSIARVRTEKGKSQILEYLCIADRSIEDIQIEERNLSQDEIPTFLSKDTKEKLLKGKVTKPHFIHPEDIKLDLFFESEGTKKIFDLTDCWLDVLETGRVLIFDELDTSLHVLLSKYLVQLFSSRNKNKRYAQLIFSTHNVSLLNKNIFRRDQIWFTEKDKNHATNLYSLLEFKPRNDQSIEKNYLLGRYGALPFIEEEDF